MSLDTEALQRSFAESGFVRLSAFVDREELKEVNERVDHFVETVVPRLPNNTVYYEDKDDLASLKQVQRLHEHDSHFARLLSGSRFEELAALLLGESVTPINMQYFNKPAGLGKETPAHQDGHYFMLNPNHAVTMWLALEDVGADQGCVCYAEGSHKRGLREHVATELLGFSQGVVDFGAEDMRRRVECVSEAGDLIAHHSLTLHWAGPNTSPAKSRKALGLIYYAASARIDEAAHAAYQRRLAESLSKRGKI